MARVNYARVGVAICDDRAEDNTPAIVSSELLRLLTVLERRDAE